VLASSTATAAAAAIAFDSWTVSSAAATTVATRWTSASAFSATTVIRLASNSAWPTRDIRRTGTVATVAAVSTTWPTAYRVSSTRADGEGSGKAMAPIV
jgi:hypothetical protein